MPGVFLTQTIRAAEERAFASVEPTVLMQRAATGLAAQAARLLRDIRGGVYGTEVLIAVGPGNNGGDGLFAGAWLARRGARVHYWPVFGETHPAGTVAVRAAGGRAVDAETARQLLPKTDLVLDAILGLGGRGGLPEAAWPFAAACKTSPALVLACDLPSGLVADSPRTDFSHLPATHTVTFGGLKLCQMAEPAKTACGEVSVIDIGLEMRPDYRVWAEVELSRWPIPGPESDKYARGVVGLDVGSAQYPGAAILAAAGAVHAGAGMVRAIGPRAAAIVDRFPNVVAAPGRVQALLIGSGWGDPDSQPPLTNYADIPAYRMARALAEGVPLVVDAEALRLLPRDLPPGSLITPHAGELARLLGISRVEVAADPPAAARAAAIEHRVTVLLKGATQYIATPDGTVALAVPGPAWTAQAGSGDVLAGVAAALLAQGRPAPEAALLAASLQAVAAARNLGPISPDRLAATFPAVIAAVASGNDAPGH